MCVCGGGGGVGAGVGVSGVWGSAPIDEVLAGRLVVRVCEGATPGFTFYRRLLRCPLVKYMVCIDMCMWYGTCMCIDVEVDATGIGCRQTGGLTESGGGQLEGGQSY